MDNNSELGIFASITRSEVTRREVVRRVLGSLGASLAFSTVARAHPVLQHINNLAVAKGAAQARSRSPQFLDSRQDVSFTALAEDIVPGSAKAHVNRMVDLLLSVSTEEDQQTFKASLAALNRESIHRFGKPYQALSWSQRDEILRLASTGEASVQNKLNVELGAQPHRGPETLRDHFENLKGWVVGVYYASEAGMRELGWTGDVFFDSFPGCRHAEEH
jgi:hypothetical protein